MFVLTLSILRDGRFRIGLEKSVVPKIRGYDPSL